MDSKKYAKILVATFLTFAFCTIYFKSPSQDKLPATTPDFHYLEFKEDALISTHALKFLLKIPLGFDQISPLNHQPTFNGHPFNVSTAALVSENMIIMVHAESVTDSSGFLDYSYMTPATLDGFDFYSRERCIEMTDEILEEAKDVGYFQENGFNFFPAIFLKQYFVNSPDGNSEYVLSYGEKVCDCSEETISEAFKEKFNSQLEKLIELTKTSSE